MKMGGGPGGGGHEVGPHRAPADFQNSVLVGTGVLFSGKRGLRFWIRFQTHFGVSFGVLFGRLLGSFLEVCCFTFGVVVFVFRVFAFWMFWRPSRSCVQFGNPFVFPFCSLLGFVWVSSGVVGHSWSA